MTESILINEERISNKMELGKSVSIKSDSFLKIKLKQKIVKYRSHNYTWENLERLTYLTPHCPKILITENGEYIQPNINVGIWEIDFKNPYELIWKLNPLNSTPIINYDKQNLKEISPATYIHTYIKSIILHKKRN